MEPSRRPGPAREAPTRRPATARRRDPTDPKWRAVELAQRGRMILDVATADLEAAEGSLGPFHPTSCHFRAALAEARRSWDRLRAEVGGAALEEALAEPPVTLLTLGDAGPGDIPPYVLVPIAGRTYHAKRLPDTPEAPILWRLARLLDPDDGPYHACRLRDGTTQCDCAEWTYQIADLDPEGVCKHLAALVALKWI